MCEGLIKVDHTKHGCQKDPQFQTLFILNFFLLGVPERGKILQAPGRVYSLLHS